MLDSLIGLLTIAFFLLIIIVFPIIGLIASFKKNALVSFIGLFFAFPLFLLWCFGYGVYVMSEWVDKYKKKKRKEMIKEEMEKERKEMKKKIKEPYLK